MNGIMFKPEMTLANLDGRKSRTSRTRGLDKINLYPDNWVVFEMKDMPGWFYFHSKLTGNILKIKCPFGQVGSVLYGKETYYVPSPKHNPVYKATLGEIGHIWKWKSPMMMPEWASRYRIILNKIIAQRINDISEDDCIKEGIQLHYTDHPYYGAIQSNPKTDFSQLWDSINLKTGHGWDRNEWVFGLYYDVKVKPTLPQEAK